MNRAVKKIYRAVPTMEGAGVHLNRIFGFYQTPQLDPFLLLDYFSSSNPADYQAGFPWHPHRGIETITYMLAGSVEHGDSMGNKGIITAGSVQWMTAGSGIIHQEMPKGGADKAMRGFQLWANLPATQKMIEPRYCEVTAAQLPAHPAGNGTMRLIAGSLMGQTGPVQEIITSPVYADFVLPAQSELDIPLSAELNGFVFVYEGTLTIAGKAVSTLECARLESGDNVIITAGPQGASFLLAAGKPLGEPIAWGGPIVMNTEEELQQAFFDLDNGTFIRS